MARRVSPTPAPTPAPRPEDRLLSDHLARLRALPAPGDRLLHYDQLFVGLLLAFFEPLMHLLLRPQADEVMGWVGVTHVRRHDEHFHTRGQATPCAAPAGR